jgi:hypothetical protein
MLPTPAMDRRTRKPCSMAKKRMSPGLILTRQAALRPFVVLLFLFLLGRGQLYEAFFLVPREELVEGLWPPCAQCPSGEAVCDGLRFGDIARCHSRCHWVTDVWVPHVSGPTRQWLNDTENGTEQCHRINVLKDKIMEWNGMEWLD